MKSAVVTQREWGPGETQGRRPGLGGGGAGQRHQPGGPPTGLHVSPCSQAASPGTISKVGAPAWPALNSPRSGQAPCPLAMVFPTQKQTGRRHSITFTEGMQAPSCQPESDSLLLIIEMIISRQGHEGSVRRGDWPH